MHDRIIRGLLTAERRTSAKANIPCRVLTALFKRLDHSLVHLTQDLSAGGDGDFCSPHQGVHSPNYVEVFSSEKMGDRIWRTDRARVRRCRAVRRDSRAGTSAKTLGLPRLTGIVCWPSCGRLLSWRSSARGTPMTRGMMLAHSCVALSNERDLALRRGDAARGFLLKDDGARTRRRAASRCTPRDRCCR